MLEQITPLLLTRNEVLNLERTLAALDWAREIVVVDSDSTDGTLALLSGFPKARVFRRQFDSHAQQWNYALHETGIRSEWVLALDADHVLSPELVAELSGLTPDNRVSGYRVRYRYCIAGQALRASLYPPLIALYRRTSARYLQDGHTQRVQVTGPIGELRGTIFHDDRKPLKQWLINQRRYASLEADHLYKKSWPELTFADRTRKLLLGPMLVLPYCLLWRGLIGDGWRGLAYSLQRLYAEILLAVLLLRRYVG